MQLGRQSTARDRCRQLQPPFFARRICVDFRYGAINEDIFKVRRISQGMESFPYTGVRPAPKAGMNRCPFAEGRRQIRQCAALAAIHKMASTNNRLSTPLRPGVPTRPGRYASIRFHCSSVRLRLLTAVLL
uniref:Uncharacterized protein n=1 Tax=Brucella ovis TaxID=236 RepID=Q45333_BRUOV|nr:unknown [Brucella ovis ATCC 25840]